MSKGQHQFSYTEGQWQEIERHLRPGTSPPESFSALFDISSDPGWWRVEISEALNDFLKSQKIGHVAVGNTDLRDFVKRGDNLLRDLIAWLDWGRGRGLIGPVLDNFRQDAERIRNDLADNRERVIQTRRGRPKRGESPFAVKNASLDQLISRLGKYFDSLNKRLAVVASGLFGVGGSPELESRSVPHKRKSKFLKACLEPLGIVCSLTAENLRQKAKRLK